MTDLLVRRSGARALGPYRLVRRGSRALGGSGLVSAGSGGVTAPPAAAGGEALLSLEANGFAADFLYPVDAERVAVKASGSVTEYAVDSFFANAGTSPKQIYYPSGALDWSPHNFLLRSQEFDNASWTKSGATIGANATTAPDATSTADAFIPNNGTQASFMNQSVAAVALTAYTVSAYVKNGTLGTNWCQLMVISTSTWRAWFNLATGAKGTSSGTPQSWNITDVGGGWYRVDMSVIPGTTTANCYLIANSADGSTGNVTGNGSSPAFYAWGAQLQRGSAVLAYLPTTTALRIGLAIDHDPSTSPATPRGLLCEPAATNLLLHSSAFDAAQWVKTAATLATNAVAAPNGTLGGDGLIPNAGSVTAAVTQVVTTVAATVYTFSAYIRNGPLSPPWVQVRLTSTGVWSAWFNLATGVKGSSAGSPTSWNIRSVGNGWYRLDITATAGTISTTIDVFPRVADADTGTVTGDGTSAAFYLWGAQFETGTVPTTSIPTFTVTATRAVDQYTCVAAPLNYSGTAGSWWAEWVAAAALTGARIVGFAGNNTPLQHSPNKFGLFNAGIAALEASVAWAAGTVCRAASAFAVGDRAVTGNGAAAAADALAATNLLATGATIYWGNASTAANPHHGWIRKASYVPRRMTNGELQAATVLDGGAGLIGTETDGFATDFLWATDAKRVAVKAAGATTEYGLDAFYQNAGTSPKMVWDAAGVLIWSPHNLCLQSEDFTNATWTKVGTPVVTAHTMEDNNAVSTAYVNQSITTVAGDRYTATAWFLKDAVTTRFPVMQLNVGANFTVQLNTATGAKVDYIISLPGVSTVEDAGTHWKLSLSAVATGATMSVRFHPAYTDVLGTASVGTVLGTITVDRVQFSRGATPTAYLSTTSAARFGLAVEAGRGLLCEPAATNLLLRSTEFDNANWVKTAATVGANAIAAPSGVLEADALIPNSGSVIPVVNNASVTVTAATAYTFSVYLKNGTLGNNWVEITPVSTSTWRVWFNLATGAKGTSVGSPTSYNITSVGNGWYRCDITVTTGTTTAVIYLHGRSADGSTAAITGDGTSPAFYAWGAQLETGAVATSPIPTLAASATRAADNYTFALSTIPALGAEYSLYGRFVTPTISGSTQAITIGDGGSGNIVGFRPSGVDNLRLMVYAASVLQVSTVGNKPFAADVPTAAAARIKLNDFGMSQDGGAVVADTVGTLPVVDQVSFGASGAATLATFRIAKMAIVPRAWTDVELVAKSKTWTPLDLGAKLKFWLSADTTVNGAVVTWTDAVGSAALAATAGQEAVSAATSFNGAYRGLTFDGVDDNYLVTPVPASVPVAATAGEIWAVASNTLAGSDTTGRSLTRYGSSAGARGISRTSVTSTNRYSLTDNLAAALVDTVIDFTGPHIVGGYWNGTEQGGRIDGRPMVPATSVIGTLATDVTRMRVGSSVGGSPTGLWGGVIRHLFVTTLLTAAERERLEGWCGQDSGLLGNLPLTHPYRWGSG